MFTAAHVDLFREKYPGIKILVHPECPMEVVDKADVRGSTGKIIREVESAPPGTKWAIGTELHLVNRLKHEHPEQEIHFLSPVVCMCATMYRIDLAHLCWSLENLAAGTPVNIIRVDDEVARWSLVALERMLAVKYAGRSVWPEPDSSACGERGRMARGTLSTSGGSARLAHSCWLPRAS